MLRRISLLVLVVAVSGLVPLIANWGSCESMPCCHHHGFAIGAAQNSDCCGPVTCAKEEKALRASSSVVHKTVVTAVLTGTPQTIVIAQSSSPAPALSPPRSTSERLSTLSILLI
ncbi:MAG TPA: hypothetical protein VGK04_06650 [Thermoanaerobaculia bacterium]|jgi:hypothetical protein